VKVIFRGSLSCKPCGASISEYRSVTYHCNEIELGGDETDGGHRGNEDTRTNFR
jgi:hypothetical protein